MKIEVRKLQNTDIEELSRIEAASFSMPWLAEDFRGLLTRDYCLYVVAEADGHIAGCAGLTDSFHEISRNGSRILTMQQNAGRVVTPRQ